ncbi:MULTISPECIES: hypothetical protein [unclassified Mycobacterium]|uniref:hypothetical protein n=1 Tax=unclassified Mycobacterium TaxID=2642494 RepID=UPI0018D3D1FB|nr:MULTISPECIES: hypothetical protein [unclassified Mycobacterium]
MVTVPDERRIAAAQSYIDALVSHDGAAVPFAPGCVRIEQGIKTGFSGKHLRRSLTRGPQYRVIAAATPPEFSIAGDEVRAVYDVVTKAALGGRRVAAHVDETFVIPAQRAGGDAQIQHITVRLQPFLRREA